MHGWSLYCFAILYFNKNPMIERRSGLSYVNFINEYVKPNVPVILMDAAKNWKAMNSFTPEFFKKNYGYKEASIQGKKYSLAEYIDLMLESTEENPAPYPCKFDIDVRFSELKPYVTPQLEILKKNRLQSPFFKRGLIPQASTMEIFFGGPGGWFPYLHYDLYAMYALVTQVYGEKEFTIYEVNQERFLYVNPMHPWQSLIDNYFKPDYKKWPLFEKAVSQKAVIKPGETLFVPLGRWHTAKSLEPTISIAQDLLNATNWNRFKDDVVFYKKRESKPKAIIYSAIVDGLGVAMSIHEKFIRAYENKPVL